MVLTFGCGFVALRFPALVLILPGCEKAARGCIIRQ